VLTDPILTGISFVDAHGALRAGQMLEVCGVGGSGKTEILMQTAVNCAMPRRRGGVDFGGCESSVLLVDLDGKFDTLRLLKILTARIKDAIVNAAARGAIRGGEGRGNGAGGESGRAEQGGGGGGGGAHAAGAVVAGAGAPPRTPAEIDALNDQVYVECMGTAPSPLNPNHKP
jgi:hypothetical protein